MAHGNGNAIQVAFHYKHKYAKLNDKVCVIIEIIFPSIHV